MISPPNGGSRKRKCKHSPNRDPVELQGGRGARHGANLFAKCGTLAHFRLDVPQVSFCENKELDYVKRAPRIFLIRGMCLMVIFLSLKGLVKRRRSERARV